VPAGTLHILLVRSADPPLLSRNRVDKPKRNTLASTLGSLLIGALFGAVIVTGFLTAQGTDGTAPSAQLGPGSLTVLIVGGVITLFLVIAAHELGHLLGGRLARFRFLLLVVGPLKITRTANGLVPSWNRSLPLAGGLAASGPRPDDLEGLARRTGYMVAGGPLTSLVLGLASLQAYRALFDAPAMATEPAFVVLVRLLMIAGLASVGIGIITLIPGKTSGFMTDGARMLQILKGGSAAEAEIAVQTLVAWSTGGVRPSEWRPEVIERALTAPAGPFQVVAQHFAWRHASATGDSEQEQIHRRALLERLGQSPELVQAGLLLDVSTQCSLSGDAVEARTLYERVDPEGAILDPHAALLARAALAAAEGDLTLAAALVDQAEALLSLAMDPGTLACDRERIGLVRALISSSPAL